jgi:hypothetical protein
MSDTTLHHIIRWNVAISARTVGRIMALNRQVYDDIPYG